MSRRRSHPAGRLWGERLTCRARAGAVRAVPVRQLPDPACLRPILQAPSPLEAARPGRIRKDIGENGRILILVDSEAPIRALPETELGSVTPTTPGAPLPAMPRTPDPPATKRPFPAAPDVPLTPVGPSPLHANALR